MGARLALLCLPVCLAAQTSTIRTGTLIDGRGNILHNQTIRVEDGKISWIATSPNIPEIDLSTYTVMPGWIGACLSISATDRPLEAASKAYRLMKVGFTTVISPVVWLRDLIDNGRYAGPRLVSHGDCDTATRFLNSIHQTAPLTMDDLLNITSRSAAALGIQDRTGSLVPGLLADLIAFKGNPLEDSAALLNIAFIMKEGHLYMEPPHEPRLILRSRLY
jgi:imidazolonepropionase-like amidohydrolase